MKSIRVKPFPWGDWVEGALVKNGCNQFLTCVGKEILKLDRSLEIVNSMLIFFEKWE